MQLSTRTLSPVPDAGTRTAGDSRARSNDAMTDAPPAPAASAAAPEVARYFGDPSQRQFGWFHGKAQPGRPAVVLCPPYGLETLSTHRTLRELATRLAAAGFATLRFDYVGTSDSAGDELDHVDAAPVLSASIDRAIDAARAYFGVPQVVLVGFRLSTLFAAATASARADVCQLVAIAPPPGGRAFVREARMFGGGVQRGEGQYAGLVLPEGFRISDATCTSISALKWPAALAASVRAALVVDRDDIPAGMPCAEALRSAGIECDYEVLPGVPQMLATPYDALVPQRIVERVIGWLRAQPPLDLPASAASEDGVAETMTLHGPNGGTISERALLVGDAPRLCGVVSEPVPAPKAPRQGLLILDRVGTGRMWVQLARRRAARGDIAVRVNVAGVGDSDLRPGRDALQVYDEDTVDDIAAIVACMRHELRIDRLFIVGLCAGAYHALNAVLKGVPIDTVFSVNQVIYQWIPGMSLDPSKADIGHLVLTKNASRSVRDLDKWKRVLRGDVDVMRHVSALARHAGDIVGRTLRPLLAPLGLGPTEDISVDKLRRATAGRTTLRLIFSSDDPGLGRLNVRASHVLPELHRTGRFSMDVMYDTDHTFTTRESQEQFFALLDGYLDARTA